MAVEFVPIDRDTPYLLPPSVQDYLPPDHLARFVVDIVDQLDLSQLSAVYAGRGSRPYHPAMMLALLFYGYSTGTFSSRKLEKATYDSIAYRYICANTYPDHDSINSFRKRFLRELKGLFVEILVIAHRIGTLKLGAISLDGTKIKANASKHKALSWQYANALEAQLTQEVAALMQLAERADNSELPDELIIPDEISRREDRLAVIRRAKEEIKARVRERDAKNQAEYEEKVTKRQQDEQRTGKKPRGKAPTPPTPGPQDKDQVNLTDAESRIMPSADGGFVQAYNAQASVDIDSGLIVTHHITQQPNDKQEVEATLAQLDALQAAVGKPSDLLADTGYLSERNVTLCLDQDITPSISTSRQRHNVPLAERLKPLLEGEPAATNDPVEVMALRLGTAAGRALYAKRKSTIEPTFGIIKHVLGFRQFLLRGLVAVEGEWDLVCIAFNLKRLHVLSG
jgi:transposase